MHQCAATRPAAARAAGRRPGRRSRGDKPEAEEAVGRPDHAQVGGTGLQHARVGVEQAEPGHRPDRRGEPDGLGQAEGDGTAEQRDAQGALAAGRHRYWCRPAPPAARPGRTPAGSADIPGGRRCRSRRPRRDRRRHPPAPWSAPPSAWSGSVLTEPTAPTRRMSREQRPCAAGPASGAPGCGRTGCTRPARAAVSAVVSTTATPPPAMPMRRDRARSRRSAAARAGSAARRRCRRRADGTSMLPVPRIDAGQRVHQPDQRRCRRTPRSNSAAPPRASAPSPPMAR